MRQGRPSISPSWSNIIKQVDGVEKESAGHSDLHL
ncbi:rCG50602 [Rattus norvegicus]|uniref:RCG50602 n=1 Tax=Rattus norvegicus TaxID=10116 RepID=A6KC22_RAT|nr:rCG50602 [Rattus norvegicus]